MINFDTKPELFVDGFVSPEGPVFAPDGTLYFCDFGVFPKTDDPSEAKERNVYRVYRDRTVEVFVNTGKTGGMPTGAAFHKDGRLFLCDSGRAELLAIDSIGNIEVLASQFRQRPFYGPNDLTFDYSGNAYFTDPKGSSAQNPIGNIYIYRSDGILELFDSNYAFPNGVALGPDRHSLYLAETQTQQIHRFTLSRDGNPIKRELFTTLSQDPVHPEYGPDGMAFDAKGNLYIAHWGTGYVDVVSAQGDLIGRLSTLGKYPTNLAFWGTFLYVTEMEHGRVIRLNVGVDGLELFGLVP